MTTSTPTGRIRHRVHKPMFCAPVLVLQVEVRIKGRYSDMHGDGPDIDRTEWRDARVEDVTTEATK